MVVVCVRGVLAAYFWGGTQSIHGGRPTRGMHPSTGTHTRYLEPAAEAPLVMLPRLAQPEQGGVRRRRLSGRVGGREEEKGQGQEDERQEAAAHHGFTGGVGLIGSWVGALLLSDVCGGCCLCVMGGRGGNGWMGKLDAKRGLGRHIDDLIDKSIG